MFKGLYAFIPSCGSNPPSCFSLVASSKRSISTSLETLYTAPSLPAFLVPARTAATISLLLASLNLLLPCNYINVNILFSFKYVLGSIIYLIAFNDGACHLFDAVFASNPICALAGSIHASEKYFPP